MRLAYTNTLIHQSQVGSDFLEGHALIVADGKIESIVPDGQVDPEIKQIDLNGNYLVPGFIDLQINGGGGVLFNDAPTVASLEIIASAHRQYGVLGFLPTIISDDFDVMRAAIEAVDTAIAQGNTAVLGIHLEGPFLNPVRKGVHNADKFRKIDAEALQLMCSLKHGKTLVTLAPELCSSDDIGYLCERGVVVSAGHSAASYEETKAALNAGVNCFTHLFNAMTPMSSREPGVVGAALEDADSYCGIIVDGFHVHSAVLKVAIAAKQAGKMILVSDAMPSVGSDSALFSLNGETIEAKNGRCVSSEGTLAGAHLHLLQAVRNCAELLDLSLPEAVRMASTYPAQLLGLESQIGQLKPGSSAKLISLSRDLSSLQIL